MPLCSQPRTSEPGPGRMRGIRRIPNRNTVSQCSAELALATPGSDRPLRMAHRLTKLGHSSRPNPSKDDCPSCQGQKRKDNESPFGNGWDVRAFAQSASIRSAGLVLYPDVRASGLEDRTAADSGLAVTSPTAALGGTDSPISGVGSAGTVAGGLQKSVASSDEVAGSKGRAGVARTHLTRQLWRSAGLRAGEGIHVLAR